MAERFYIVDGTALVYRSYFAFIRNPLINARGENTSAAFGFAAGLLRLIRDEKPDYLVVTFDSKEPTFRHKMFAEYKATREKMPDDLVDQLHRIDEIVSALNIESLAIPGYEADDIMGTLAQRAYDAGMDAVLVTGDKDLMQLVNDRVTWMNLKKSGQENEVLDPDGVREKFGAPPDKVVDVLALMGDASDNVPGIPGVGPKTAIKLIEEFAGLENILDGYGRIKQKGLREKIEKGRESALLSRELVTIDRNVPIELDIMTCALREPDAERARALFQELEFTSLIEQLPKLDNREAAARNYETVLTRETLDALVQELRERPFVFDLETTGLDALTAEIVGFAFSLQEGAAYYVPVASPDVSAHLAVDEAVAALKPVLEDAACPKAAQNAKYDCAVLRKYGVIVRGVAFDTMIAAFLLQPEKRRYNLDALSEEYLALPKIPTSDIIGSGAQQVTMDTVPVETVAEYACEDADYTFRLWRQFEPELKEKQLDRLNAELELPLIDVLIGMEEAGVALDTAFLKEMSGALHRDMDILTGEIHQLAGEEFNIGSPQQLGNILFDKLKVHEKFGVKRVKKTKIGYSTDVSVLEKFRGDEIVQRVLDFRRIAKLLSTYVDALPALIHPKTGRVHTSFNQTIAATGRLSSTNPNLQNIPIRTEQGREIRKAFVPRQPGWRILSADYSQIELRILAHLAKDETMQSFFREGQDIHTMTAAKIFGLDAAAVTPDLRYRAKAINFGIIYGMSSYRLAREVGISNDEAQDFIYTYFTTFPGVNNYIANELARARERGYVTTMFGRRRYVPELLSGNQRLRQTAENVAVNTPVQGTAAELIKFAMIRLHERLETGKFRAKLVLQIHDELVLDVPEEELETVAALVSECMENAVALDVPLLAEAGSGANWFEAH